MFNPDDFDPDDTGSMVLTGPASMFALMWSCSPTDALFRLMRMMREDQATYDGKTDEWTVEQFNERPKND